MPVGALQLKACNASHGAASDYTAAAQEALASVFGFTEFRGKQWEAISGILSGRDVFVLMPTGGGKSLCYGLPPLIKPGVTVVVSPLIALMEDQVQSFQAKGVRAMFLSSTQAAAQRSAIMEDLHKRQPTTQLLFVTPELLDTDGFLRTLRWMYSCGSLLMVAVDEAHCISSWGHQFRTSYRKLWVVRQELQGVPIMALTATASSRVQDDVCQQLRLRNPLRLVSTFNRPNIHYQVRYVDVMPSPSGKGPLTDPLPDLVALLEGERQSSPSGQVPCCIVYTHTREAADIVAHQLTRRGIACKAYHAGLPDRERSHVLAEWLGGEVQVVVATVAFGMGIDRADVRFVVHYNLPKTVEGFYQESGRAGRDGAPAKSILYYSTADRQSLEFLLEHGKDKLKRQHPPQQQDPAVPTQLQSFGQVVEYCLAGRCRRSFLLSHFGENAAPSRRAGCCDVCDDDPAVAVTIRQLQTAGVQRRQRFLGAKHSLDFSRGRAAAGGGGGGGGGALEFELDRPGEGLDFDVEAPSTTFQDEDGIEDEEEGAFQAQAALKRARRSGVQDAEGLLAAMESAERRYNRQEAAAGAGQGSKLRLLAKLEARHGSGGAHLGKGRAGDSGVPEVLRQNARKQLSRAIAGKPCLAAAFEAPSAAGCQLAQQGSVGDDLVEAAACALEQQCWEGVHSKPVYQSKMANLVVQVTRAQQLADVPQLAALATEWVAGGEACQNAEAVPAAPQGRMEAQQPDGGRLRLHSTLNTSHGTLQQQQQQQSLPPPPQQQRQLTTEERLCQLVAEAQQAASRDGPGEEESAARAMHALRQLAEARVSADLLLQTGAGRQVNALNKHASAEVAAAAAEVVRSWKAAILADTSAH